MVKMIGMVQELNELAQNPQMILRFKCLSTGQQAPKKIVPWLLQLTMRRILGGLGELGPMASRPDQTPPASVESQSTGRTLGAEPQRRIFREEAARACLSLQLENSGATCYVNATLLAMTWGAIQRHDANWAGFSHCPTAMQEFLTPGPGMRLALDADGFAPLRGLWGSFHNQADAHEFLQQFLGWANLRHIDVSWERRLLNQEQLQILDSGSKVMPPTVCAPDAEKKTLRLSDMIADWHAYRGMKTCFTHEAPMIGIHVDRFASDDSGAIRKQTWSLELEDSILLPFWTDESLHLRWREYIPVAVISHSDLDANGHLQAGLLTPGDGTSQRIARLPPSMTPTWRSVRPISFSSGFFEMIAVA